MRQRDAETGSGIETQTELGLDQADFTPAPVADPAPMEADETPEADLNTAELAPSEQRGEGTKRELLPDIEEINSMFYAYAPALVEKFPQFEGQITGAVAILNTLRGALETGAQSLLRMLNGLLEGFRN